MTAIPIARSLIYSEVEREHQHSDEKYGGVEHDDTHLPNDWIALVARYSGKAESYPACAKDWSADDRARFRMMMVRVANVAISAVEYADRKAGSTSQPSSVPEV